jgi:hypothetical protein
MLADVPGRLAAPIVVTSGNVSDITVAPVLLEDLVNTAVVRDKGYDSRELRDDPARDRRRALHPGPQQCEKSRGLMALPYAGQGMSWKMCFSV